MRATELMSLQIEKMTSSPEGVHITHQRCKQRSDKRETKFLVPRNKDLNRDWAGLLEGYIKTVKEELGKTTGRVFWRGCGPVFVNQPLGRNKIADIPHEMAKFLEKPNIEAFTFHSYRRSAATASADSGASEAQLCDFFGWRNSKMANEYISTSKTAVNRMAGLLAPAPNISSSVSAPIQLPGDQVQEQPKQQYLTTPVTSTSTALHHTDQTVLSHRIGQPGLFKSIENNNKVIVISNCHGVTIN